MWEQSSVLELLIDFVMFLLLAFVIGAIILS